MSISLTERAAAAAKDIAAAAAVEDNVQGGGIGRRRDGNVKRDQARVEKRAVERTEGFLLALLPLLLP